jgi:hypothetical protein
MKPSGWIRTLLAGLAVALAYAGAGRPGLMLALGNLETAPVRLEILPEAFPLNAAGMGDVAGNTFEGLATGGKKAPEMSSP